MSPADIIILLLLGVVIFFCLRSVIRNMKNGGCGDCACKGSCNGSCSTGPVTSEAESKTDAMKKNEKK